MVATTKNDSLQFDILVQMNDYYQSASVYTNFYYAERILDFAEKTKNKKLIAYATLTIGYPFFRIGDYLNVQDYIIRASKIIDRYPNDEIEARINNYKNLIEPDNNKKIAYLQKAITIITRQQTTSRITAILYLNLARTFYSIQQLDSALFYVQKANEFAFEQADYTRIILLQSTFANIYTGLKQYDLANIYCRRCLSIASVSSQVDVYLRAYQCMFTYFVGTGQNDSALYYQKKHFLLMQKILIKPGLHLQNGYLITISNRATLTALIHT